MIVEYKRTNGFVLFQNLQGWLSLKAVWCCNYSISQENNLSGQKNPLPDKDEEDEKQEDHEVKDVGAGPIRNEVWPGCHTLAITT